MAYFPPYKTPKTYLPVTSLQPRGYIAKSLRFFYVVVEGPKRCLPAAQFSCDFWYGSSGPPNLPKVLPIAYSYTPTEFYYTACQIWTKDVWKRAILRTTKYLLPYPIKSPQNPILVDLFVGLCECNWWFSAPSDCLLLGAVYKFAYLLTFNAKPIIQIALHKSNVNWATKLKRYSYIGIGKY